MERYACSPHDIPKNLYRVHYPGAQVHFSPETGLAARDRTRMFSDDSPDELAQAIIHQFTWSYRDPLPFISFFSDLEHAQNWGRKTPWSPNGTARYWTLHTIDTTSIRTTHTFFRLSDIVRRLSVTIPKNARQHIEGAFICLHDIPIGAIQESRTHIEVEQGTILAPLQHGITFTMLELIVLPDREFLEEKDRYDYLGEYGNDDSDREMMQENCNTIFDKNIEDGW